MEEGGGGGGEERRGRGVLEEEAADSRLPRELIFLPRHSLPSRKELSVEVLSSSSSSLSGTGKQSLPGARTGNTPFFGDCTSTLLLESVSLRSKLGAVVL